MKKLLLLLVIILQDLPLCAQINEVFSTPLPILKITTDEAEIPEEPPIPAEMGIVWHGEGNMNNSDDEANAFWSNINIDKRGYSSIYFFPKNGYAIETKDENGEDQDTSFLNFPTEEDWILHGPYSDKSLLRNVLAMHIANGMGNYNSRTRFVELMINNEYEGLYVMMEKIKRDENRLDIATLNEIDIEGDEFKILKDIDKNFDKINLLIIEFHDLQKNLSKIKNFIKKTRLKNIHINANNYSAVDKFGIPHVIEMTLINPKKFKIKNKKTNRNYPIKGLDFKNRKRGKEINITFS